MVRIGPTACRSPYADGSGDVLAAATGVPGSFCAWLQHGNPRGGNPTDHHVRVQRVPIEEPSSTSDTLHVRHPIHRRFDAEDLVRLRRSSERRRFRGIATAGANRSQPTPDRGGDVRPAAHTRGRLYSRRRGGARQDDRGRSRGCPAHGRGRRSHPHRRSQAAPGPVAGGTLHPVRHLRVGGCRPPMRDCGAGRVSGRARVRRQRRGFGTTGGCTAVRPVCHRRGATRCSPASTNASTALARTTRAAPRRRPRTGFAR